MLFDSVDKAITYSIAAGIDPEHVNNTVSVFRELTKPGRPIRLTDCFGEVIELPPREALPAALVEEEIISHLSFLVNGQIDIERAKKHIAKVVNSGVEKDIKKWFVTVNFADGLFDDSYEARVINQVVDKLLSPHDKFVVENYVVEKFREGGTQIHRHIHMKVHSDEKYKSKIVEAIFKSVPKVKGYKEKFYPVSAKNFIDCEVFMSYHENYIKGDKCDEKLICVEKDRQWRLSKGIREFNL